MSREIELIDILIRQFEKYDNAIIQLARDNSILKEKIRKLEAKLNTPKDSFKTQECDFY